MKKIYCIIICCILFFVLKGIAFAETYDSYIVKYEGEDFVHVITAEEKESLFDSINLFAVTEDDKKIEYIEPNYDVYLYDNISNKDWNSENINATSLSEYGCYGNGVKVAVLDSGVSNYIGLENKILSGYNIISNTDDVEDNIGHGTFVCGLIANSNKNEYAQGISQNANIIPIKCFEKNYSTKVDKIAEAIDLAVNSYNCDIINMSFGLNGNSAYLKSKIDMALQKNIIIVAAVGNSGTESLRYPAAYDGVIGVGAVDSENSWCNFSQHNDSVDLVAPGQNICGISIGGYTENTGTSFAAPHVTATAAIALSIDKSLTPTKFYELLKNTSVDLGDEGYDTYYGYGLLNIGNVVEQLIGQFDIFMSPINIDSTQCTVVIKNNTDSSINAINILYGYNNNALCQITPIKLNGHEKIIITHYTDFTGTIKSFLWENLNTLKPLTSCRQYIE